MYLGMYRENISRYDKNNNNNIFIPHPQSQIDKNLFLIKTINNKLVLKK